MHPVLAGEADNYKEGEGGLFKVSGLQLWLIIPWDSIYDYLLTMSYQDVIKVHLHVSRVSSVVVQGKHRRTLEA